MLQKPNRLEGMQNFASGRLRPTIIGNLGNIDREIISNYNIMAENQIPTIQSQLLRDKLRDVRKWGTSLPYVYLNKIDERGDLVDGEICRGGDGDYNK